MDKIKKHKKRLLIVIITLVVDGLFFTLTDPITMNSAFLILALFIFGISIYIFLDNALFLINGAGLKIRNRLKLALYLSIIITILVSLQTIGQLTIRDVLVIVPLTLVMYFYINYVRPKTKD